MRKLVYNFVSRKIAEENGGGISSWPKKLNFVEGKVSGDWVSNTKALNCQQINEITGLMREH